MGVFSTEHAGTLLHNKFVVFIGDSVQRSAYKDLVVLLKENRFVKDSELKTKGEKSFMGDCLVERSELTNGTNYKEVREFKTDHCLVRFYFITRIFNEYVESILKDFLEPGQPSPDVIMVNSCLWDISRYGLKGRELYAQNLEKFCSRLDEVVSAKTCIIWKTALPLGSDARGGFLTNNDANRTALLLDVCLANYRAYDVVTRHKYDVIDMHYHFAGQMGRLAKDGVHWNQYAHRRMTNMFLTHVSMAWSLGEPPNPVVDNANVKSREICLSKPQVLTHAYGPNSAIPRPPLHISEERYGGPIRSSEEMLRYYNNFYNFEEENIPIQEPQRNPYMEFFPHPHDPMFQPYDFRREQMEIRSRLPDPDWNLNWNIRLPPDTHMNFPQAAFTSNLQEPYNRYPPSYHPNQLIARQAKHSRLGKFRPYLQKRPNAFNHQF